MECIGKDKAASPYDCGIRASIVTNNLRAPGALFALHARALAHPYDGHTLRDVIDCVETLTGCAIERAYVDKGYRGPRRAKSSPNLHLWPEARHLQRHQVRAAPCAAAPPSNSSSDTDLSGERSLAQG